MLIRVAVDGFRDEVMLLSVRHRDHGSTVHVHVDLAGVFRDMDEVLGHALVYIRVIEFFNTFDWDDNRSVSTISLVA